MPPAERTDPDVPINHLPIRLRGYTVRNVAKSDFDPPPKVGPSGWTLTFDCETTIDAAQRLRFGAFQLRNDGVIRTEGLFHDPDLPPDDLTTLATGSASSKQKSHAALYSISRRGHPRDRRQRTQDRLDYRQPVRRPDYLRTHL